MQLIWLLQLKASVFAAEINISLDFKPKVMWRRNVGTEEDYGKKCHTIHLDPGKHLHLQRVHNESMNTKGMKRCCTMNSQSLWMPVQDRASQHSMEEEGLQAPSLTKEVWAVDGVWGQEKSAF